MAWNLEPVALSPGGGRNRHDPLPVGHQHKRDVDRVDRAHRVERGSEPVRRRGTQPVAEPVAVGDRFAAEAAHGVEVVRARRPNAADAEFTLWVPRNLTRPRTSAIAVSRRTSRSP